MGAVVADPGLWSTGSIAVLMDGLSDLKASGILPMQVLHWQVDSLPLSQKGRLAMWIPSLQALPSQIPAYKSLQSCVVFFLMEKPVYNMQQHFSSQVEEKYIYVPAILSIFLKEACIYLDQDHI